MKFKPNTVYEALHKPSGKIVQIIGVDKDAKKVHANGAIHSMDEFKNFSQLRSRTTDESSFLHKLKTIKWN